MTNAGPFPASTRVSSLPFIIDTRQAAVIDTRQRHLQRKFLSHTTIPGALVYQVGGGDILHSQSQ